MEIIILLVVGLLIGLWALGRALRLGGALIRCSGALLPLRAETGAAGLHTGRDTRGQAAAGLHDQPKLI